VVFGKNDVLITDASDGAIESGQTSAAVLKAALKRGAQIVSIAGLHTKLYVFDRYAIIGSANLSKGSEKRTEAAILTDHPEMVSASWSLIDKLAGLGEPVDVAFISRISKLSVARMRAISTGGRRILKDPLPRTWLVGLTPITNEDEEPAIVAEGRAEAQRRISDEDSDVWPIQFRGNSRFRREGRRYDLVICIWTMKRNGKPKTVYAPSKILLRQEDPAENLTRFYVEEYPDAEQTALTWGQFQRIYTQSGIPGRLSQWPSREIARHHADSLHSLWPKQ
jgi:hypothetical protein